MRAKGSMFAKKKWVCRHPDLEGRNPTGFSVLPGRSGLGLAVYLVGLQPVSCTVANLPLPLPPKEGVKVLPNSGLEHQILDDAVLFIHSILFD